MAVLKVLTYPDPRLKLKAPEVTEFDQALKDIVKDMLETMYHDHGCGLAATQVNIQQRIVVMDTSADGDSPKCLINPKIVATKGEGVSEEGCLSFPGAYAKIKRAAEVTCEYYDEEGKSHTITATGLESFCIQHEIEHLDGVTFIDKLSKLKRNLLIKKIEKYQRVVAE